MKIYRTASRLLYAASLWSVLFGPWPAQCRAQTIAPVIVEYVEKAEGKFQIVNNSLYPLNVVLEPKSFAVDAQGNPSFHPLEPGIHVRLSTMSFRLPARQTFIIFYKAEADRLPAWFTIYATMVAPTKNDFKVALALPHTVYLLTRNSLSPDSVSLNQAEFRREERCVQVEVENRGERFGRVQEVELLSASGKKTYASFPLFPGQRRRLHLDWELPVEPQRIVLKFRHFKLEHSIPIVARSQ